MKLLKYLFLTLVLAGVLLTATGAGMLYYLVALVPAPEMDNARIDEILGRESPVFYRDGVTPLGVLFEGVHRKYLKFEELPKSFVNALLAAEDDQFYSHMGIDIPGIVRAMLANIKAGKIVQGGSTITQQTAKNLFKRESRDMKSKLKELLYALRLERKYSKEKILEFYSNQFFVSGTGHGLGVAARYFFDKHPSELTLVEAAFIAGSVKRPNYYNPFLQKNVEDPQEMKRRATERVRYVLEQMLKRKMLSQEEFAAARTSELIFKQGKMSFGESATMDLVKEGVSSPIITDALEEQGISNISTSGVRIIASVEKNLQDAAVYALRRRLSHLDVRLRGYERKQVQEEYQALTYGGDPELLPGAFLFGTVMEGGKEDKSALLRVKLAGNKEALLTSTGLDQLAEPLAIYRRGSGARPGPEERRMLLAQLHPGDKIYVSVRRESSSQGEPLLDLERYPQVEGAAVVIQEGVIRAVSGGMSNIHFNRATTARRLMGSTFKPFVFAAAMQLGWTPLDMLENRRDGFIFMDRPYFPKPDHQSPHARVTMSWAGVTSENVAAVWLLYHLTDHLSGPAIRELAQNLDMAPREKNGALESASEYQQRMRSQFGIWLAKGSLEEGVFDAAVRALKPDFLFAGQNAEYQRLTRLNYGARASKYAATARNASSAETRELQANVSFLSPSYQGVRSLLPKLQAYRASLAHRRPRPDPDLIFHNPAALQGYAENNNDFPARRDLGRLTRGAGGRVIYTQRQNGGAEAMFDEQALIEQLNTMSAAQVEQFWEQVELDGILSVSTVRQVERQMALERPRFFDTHPYSVEILSELRDFRIMLGLQYLIRLAQACGVESNLEPVLSFTLGANVVTLSEMTRVYETMITGLRFDPGDPASMRKAAADGDIERDGASLIERIETPEGRVVYARQQHTTRIFDPRIAAQVANILQNTVSYGTGKLAAEQVRLKSDDPAKEKILKNMPLPLLGKTGTANDYRNAAFFGYVPMLAPNDPSIMVLEGGYALGVYTGYDINERMVKGSSRVSGAVGALPAWSDIAQSLLDQNKLAEQLDAADLSFSGLSLKYPEVGQIFVPVDPKQGGAVISAKAGARQNYPPSWTASLGIGAQEKGVFEPERLFIPFWRSAEESAHVPTAAAASTAIIR